MPLTLPIDTEPCRRQMLLTSSAMVKFWEKNPIFLFALKAISVVSEL
jgi:hypothetical protein